MTEPIPSVPVSAAASPRRSSRSPGMLFAAARVFELSLVQMLWSRRTIFMALVVGFPVVLAVILRLLVEIGIPVTRVGRAEITGPVLFGLMIWGFFVRFSIPVLAVFYGTSLVADEVEDKTITYLFTRPVPRAAVVLGKYLAYLACTLSVVLPSVMLVWLLIAPIGATLGQSFLNLTKDLAVLGLGLAAYGAVFAWVGAGFKRPLVFGLIFVFGWEMLVMALPGYLKRATVAYYLEGLVPHTMPSDTTLTVLQSFFREVPGLGESLLGLGFITAAALWLAGRTASRREYVLEQ